MTSLFCGILLFIVYLLQNIARNLLVNILEFDYGLATLLTVFVGIAFSLLLSRNNGFFGLNIFNKQNFEICVISIILIVLNLVPFELEKDISVVGIVSQAIFVGFIEELIFQGYIYEFLLEKKTEKSAIIVSSILFGFIHILNLANSDILFVAIQILSSISMGIIYAVHRSKSKSIVLCMLSHALIDIAAFFNAEQNIVVECIIMLCCMVSAFGSFFRIFKERK